MDVGAVQRLVGELHKRATDGEAIDDGYPYSRLQQIGYFVLFFFPILAFCVWVLRIYGRFSTKQYSWDDLLITMAMALSIAETICSYYSMRLNYIGIHKKDIPITQDFVLGQKWAFTIQILYNPILALVKTSVLLFLMRLGGQKREVRLCIISLLIFNLCQMVAMFFACVFQCTPVSYFWDRMKHVSIRPDGMCINQNAFYIATSSLTILTDVLVLVLPFWIFLGLKLPLKVRAAIIGVFVLGGAVTIMSILRMSWLIETAYFTDIMDPDLDWSYDIRFTYSAVETNLAIITASAPALRPLFLQWFPKFFSALKSSGNKYSSTRDGYGRSTATGTAKRSRGGTGVRSSLAGPFPLKDIKGRSEIRSHSPTNSEEEIMTYNGILKTSEVAVQYGERVPATHLRDDSETESSRYGFGPRASHDRF
ncbi:hypothetical protein CEP54_002331 [Fusarium duplospermum]|uniref:Rhodopsin domain-containing protein n=1 Tax=Fusarium duplospermum TaxID=1325734 RepID=A0A428QW87_9HYPO|nr:hypothetical protein CEP54_002331 [Fusarium duplospermum]